MNADTDVPTTDDVTNDDVERMSVDEAIHQAEAIECNGRAWLKTLTPLLQVLMVRGEDWNRDADTTEAVDDLIAAACCRAARICRRTSRHVDVDGRPDYAAVGVSPSSREGDELTSITAKRTGSATATSTLPDVPSTT
jgi:hypothetical protein